MNRQIFQTTSKDYDTLKVKPPPSHPNVTSADGSPQAGSDGLRWSTKNKTTSRGRAQSLIQRLFLFLFFSTLPHSQSATNAPLDTRADPSSKEETCVSPAPSAGMPDHRAGIHGAALAGPRKGRQEELVESPVRETRAWMAAAVPIRHPAVRGFGDDV